MATVSTNEIIVQYKIGNPAELDKLVSTFAKVSDEEKESLEVMKEVSKQLKQTGNEGEKAMSKVEKKTREATNEAKKLGSETSEAGNKGGRSLKNLNQELDKAKNNTSLFATSLKSVGGLLAGAFAVDKLMAFGKSVFNVTAEFEKMQAVLRNTLGSNSAAMVAMETIKNFAKTTPFSVQQLTDSFIKLANQGFQPNVEEMRKLGDLASSTGKTFDQLTEAIIDAQVGEFERLKEFGVRAKKEGENVIFTFKGVETQVANNNAAIRQYIISLGDLNGVSGSAAAISETLGGKVNNLGDAWDNFLNKVGTLLKPVLTEALTVTAEFMDEINNLFSAGKTKAEVYASTELLNFKSYQKLVMGMTDDELQQFVDKQQGKLRQSQEEVKKYTAESLKYGKAVRLSVEELGVGPAEVLTAIKLVDEANQDVAARKGMIAAAQEQINLRERASATTAAQEQKMQEDKAKAEKEAKKQAEERLKILEKEFQAEKNNLELQKEVRQLNADLNNNPGGRAAADREYYGALAKLKEDYKARGIDITQQDIENDRIRQQIAAKEVQNTEIQNMALYKEDQKAADDKEKLIKQEMDARVKANEEANKTINDQTKEFLDKEYQQILEAREKQKQLEEQRIAAITSGLDLASNLFTQFVSLRNSQLDNELVKVNRNAAEEVRLADGNAQKLQEIEQKRAAKEKEIRTKQFRAEQAAAVARVIFETASMIAKWASNPVTFPLAAIALLNQTAQIGFILAQPVPEFAKGVENFQGGFAIVGEQGPELIKTPKGNMISPGKPTLTYLPKGSDVITAPKTKEILGLSSSYKKGQDKFVSVDVAPIAEAVRSIPVQSLHITERGLERFVQRGNRSTRILNKRRQE